MFKVYTNLQHRQEIDDLLIVTDEAAHNEAVLYY